MWTRSLIFLGAQLLGAGLGFALHGAWGALAGAAAVVWLWFLVDLMRAGRVLRSASGTGGREKPSAGSPLLACQPSFCSLADRIGWVQIQ